MPEIESRVPPHEWELSAFGRRSAESLTHVLPADARLVSSNEPKARQTLEPCGDVLASAWFDEVRRDESFERDVKSRRRAYLAGADHPGWESRQEVATRFEYGVQYLIRAGYDWPWVIASHGMAMTLWLTAFARLPDPVGFWSDLRLPDVLAVNLRARTVGRVLSTQLCWRGGEAAGLVNETAAGLVTCTAAGPVGDSREVNWTRRRRATTGEAARRGNVNHIGDVRV